MSKNLLFLLLALPCLAYGHETHDFGLLGNVQEIIASKTATLAKQNKEYGRCRNSEQLNMPDIMKFIRNARKDGYKIKYLVTVFGCEYLNASYYLIATKDVESRTVAFVYNSLDKKFRKISLDTYHQFASIADNHAPSKLVVHSNEQIASDPVLTFVFCVTEDKVFVSLSSNASMDHHAVQKLLSLLPRGG